MTDSPDLELPWVRREGEPREGPPHLNRQNLFLLACREAFRGGGLSAAEKDFLSKFAAALQLPANEARGFARLAKQEADEGKLGPAVGELDPKVVYKKACALAHAKGKLIQEEREILGRFSEALGIPMMRVDATLKQLAVKVEQGAREEKPEIQLARERNLDGSEAGPPPLEDELSQSWGAGDPLTRSGVMRLGVHLPGVPRRAGAPSKKKPAAPPAPWKGPATTLGLAAALGLGALKGLHHLWFVAEAPAVPLLALAGLGLLAALGLAASGAFGMIRALRSR